MIRRVKERKLRLHPCIHSLILLNPQESLALTLDVLLLCRYCKRSRESFEIEHVTQVEFIKWPEINLASFLLGKKKEQNMGKAGNLYRERGFLDLAMENKYSANSGTTMLALVG